ncbi:uncharacterized protein LOC127104311 [Lathyrus oleraceus]|uniref:uncharacterized protein LOC127104311 n=1 Tax=Pisum sativum TaxID=3888 RepID=UPI0021D00117|nr:uncharacterized protein LOC127104311 [Pisum sativum]
MRLKQRSSKREKVAEQAQQAKFIKKVGKVKEKQIKCLVTTDNLRENSKNHNDSIKKGMFNNNLRKKIYMKEVSCYNFQKLSHYATYCYLNKDLMTNDIEEVKFAHAGGSDSDDVLLMANTQPSDDQAKKVIRFADGMHITLEGKGNIIVVRKDGMKDTISDALYVPFMTCNLISISQLLAKGYNMKMVVNQMKVFVSEGRLILRVPFVENKTFKIEINMVDHKCLSSTVKEDNN